MISWNLRTLSGRALAAASGGALLALTALAVGSGSALIGHSFDRALLSASVQPTTAPTLATGATAAAGEAGLWLTRTDQPAAPSAQGLARVGERITITVEGGRQLDLEVVALSELSGVPGAADQTPSPRLVMMTAREMHEGERPARTFRVIVEADDALASTTSTTQPARTL
jgi:hypothetical protein